MVIKTCLTTCGVSKGHDWWWLKHVWYSCRSIKPEAFFLNSKPKPLHNCDSTATPEYMRLAKLPTCVDKSFYSYRAVISRFASLISILGIGLLYLCVLCVLCVVPSDFFFQVHPMIVSLESSCKLAKRLPYYGSTTRETEPGWRRSPWHSPRIERIELTSLRYGFGNIVTNCFPKLWAKSGAVSSRMLRDRDSRNSEWVTQSVTHPEFSESPSRVDSDGHRVFILRSRGIYFSNVFERKMNNQRLQKHDIRWSTFEFIKGYSLQVYYVIVGLPVSPGGALWPRSHGHGHGHGVFMAAVGPRAGDPDRSRVPQCLRMRHFHVAFMLSLRPVPRCPLWGLRWDAWWKRV